MGLEKTKSLLRKKVNFPGLDTKVEEYIKRCAICQVRGKQNGPAELLTTPTPEEVWDTVNIDYLGPLTNGFYLVVLIDQASKFPVVDIIHNTSADLLIDFLQKTIAVYGIPKTIVSDNGTPFTSFKIKMFLNKLNIQHKRITPLWPQANSQAESFMKPLIKTIRAAHIERKNWKKQLYNFLFSYRTTPHCTTRIPLSTLMFNRVTDFTIPSFQTRVDTNINDQAKKRQENAKLYRKKYHDLKYHAKNPSLNIGDTVLIKQKKYNKITAPLEFKPYTITAKNGTMITSKSPVNNSQKTRNASHMKKAPTDIQFNPIPIKEEKDEETPERINFARKGNNSYYADTTKKLSSRTDSEDIS
nr:uncharacterized protein K02A2.6-like [Hydra vulgaris]